MQKRNKTQGCFRVLYGNGNRCNLEIHFMITLTYQSRGDAYYCKSTELLWCKCSLPWLDWIWNNWTCVAWGFWGIVLFEIISVVWKKNSQRSKKLGFWPRKNKYLLNCLSHLFSKYRISSTSQIMFSDVITEGSQKSGQLKVLNST